MSRSHPAGRAPPPAGGGKFRATVRVRARSGGAPADWAPRPRCGRERGQADRAKQGPDVPVPRRIRGAGSNRRRAGWRCSFSASPRANGGWIPRAGRAARRGGRDWKVISPLKNRSSWPANGLFGRRAPLATVFTSPCSSVNQWTIRLVSVSRVRRMRMACVDCMTGSSGNPGELAMENPENWKNCDDAAVSIQAALPNLSMKPLILAVFSAFIGIASAEEAKVDIALQWQGSHRLDAENPRLQGG